jgi:hypothetical protein
LERPSTLSRIGVAQVPVGCLRYGGNPKTGEHKRDEKTIPKAFGTDRFS